ncbi:Phage protein [Citrobacter sedlakii]
MAKYIVTIEGFSDCKVVEFEADTQEEAEEIGRDIFHEECNFGVSLASED